MRSNVLYTETVAQFRKYQPTQNQYARHREAAMQDAKTFISMLQANRGHQELLDKYHAKQASTTQAAAHRVGLELPKN